MDTSGYVGVDHEYRNYANETDRPLNDDEQRRTMAEAGIPLDSGEEFVILPEGEEVSKETSEEERDTSEEERESNGGVITPTLNF